jgi:hypothetical protein
VLEILSRVPSVDITASGQLRLLGRSGAKILIDGREVTNPLGVLGNLQGSQIVRIEVMSNPSAQFSAQGTAGIINVITRRSHRPRLGGSLVVSAGTLGNFDAKVSPTWARGPLSLSASLGASRTGSRADFSRERYEIDPAFNILGRQSEAGTSTIRSDGLIGSLFATYRLSDRETLSATVIARQGDGARSERSALVRSGFPGEILEQTRSATDRFASRDYSLEYRRDGERKGESLTISTQHSSSTFVLANSFLFQSPSLGSGTFIVNDSSSDNLASLKIDYIRPGGGKKLLTAGVSIERRSEKALSLARGALPFGGIDVVESSGVSGSWTNEAGYATYQFPLLGVVLLPGIRVESRQYDLSGAVAGVNSGGTHLFPTLHLERRLSASAHLNLSYSRRIAWPDIGALSPAVRFSDSTTVTVGNLFLRPEITDSYEAKFTTKVGKRNVAVTAYSRHTRDLFSNLRELNADGVLVSRRVNLGVLTLRGADMSVRGPISPRLSYSATADIAAESISDDLIEHSLLKSRPQYSFSAQLEYQQGPRDRRGADRITLSYRYNGPIDRGLFSFSPYSYLSGSWSHMITDRVGAVVNVGRVLIPSTTKSTSYSRSTIEDQFNRPAGLKIVTSLTYSLRPTNQP